MRSQIRSVFLAVVVCISCIASAFAADRFNSASGSWPQWRGGPQQTGSQALPGAMRRPSISGSVRIGGLLNPYQILAAPAADLVILAPPGQLAGHRSNGERLWSRPYQTDAAIVGLFDLNTDGHLELVTSSHKSAGGMLDIFDAASGTPLWSTSVDSGGTGAVEVGDLNGDGTPDLVWAPAAGSTVRAFSFSAGIETPQLLWERVLPDYTSDPYSFSPVVIANIHNDGSPEVIIAGGRGQFTVWILGGTDGSVLERADYFGALNPPRVVEGGGLQQMLAVRDIDSDGAKEIIVVGGHTSSATYMFQGLAVIDPANISEPLSLDTHPVGLKYVEGSLQDFDGDGKDDLLYSIFDPASQQHVLNLIDPKTFAVKRQATGFALVAVIRPVDGAAPVIVAREGVTVEVPAGPGDFAGMLVGETAFEPPGWRIRATSVVTMERPFDEDPAIANAGPRPVTVDADSNGRRDALFMIADQIGNYAGVVDLATGAVLSSIVPPPGDSIRAIHGSSSGYGGVFSVLSSGNLVLTGDDLSAIGSFSIGGYFRLLNSNGHNHEVAMISDIDHDGVNEIYANGSNFDLLRVRHVPTGLAVETFSRSRGTAEPIEIPGPGPSLLVRSCTLPASLCRVDSEGTKLWSASPSEFVSSALSPVALNVGRDTLQERSLIFASGSSVYPMPLYAVDGSSGALLWTSSNGPYWDGSIGVADFDRDGVDDVAFNFATQKGTILSGRDGTMICEAAVGPTYGPLGYVDYNGVPIIADVGDDGFDDIIIGEDNAHLVMITPCTAPGRASSQVIWAAQQEALDDERLSMPALAIGLDARALIATGTKRGRLIVRYADSGLVAWQIPLSAGAIAAPDRSNELSSVLALDVDGDGSTEFVVGGEDGWMYAVSAITGNLVWSLSFGAAVGDPIAGDVDGDGRSEIVVPAADGYLYIVDGDGVAPPERSDFDSDGRPDVLLRNYNTGQNALWLMNGTELAGVVDLPGLSNVNYRFEGTADFDGDGYIDIVLRNYATGQNAIWLMKGAVLGGIVDLPALPNTEYHFEGTGDFDGNGMPDIILRNQATGQNALWLMNGTGVTSVVDLPGLANTSYAIETAADFNGDGRTDIVLRNYATGQNAVWLMNGTTLLGIVDLPALPNVSYRIDAVGDFDMDGKPDIVLRNYSSGQNAVWLMNGTDLGSIVDLPALVNTSYHITGPR